MDGTPRLRSAFPKSPPSARQGQNDSTPPRAKFGSSLPDVSEILSKAEITEQSSPVIPYEILDAASQRLYVAGFYAMLWAWRFYDFANLVRDDTESLWQFMKWITIDGVFLFGLPAMRIPWLEWSSGAVTVLFLLHAVIDGMLMFKIGLPITAWLAGLVKLLYDRELAIAEHRVKPADLVQNASLILGRQIIHILPEGSAMLNPHKESFCISPWQLHVDIPIQINQTQPIMIELLRIDLDTMQNETITIASSASKKLRKEAVRRLEGQDTTSPLVLKYQVKKTGLYLLQKVVDESKLEVQRRLSEVVVVPCPQARVRPTSGNRCKGELSNIALEVEGTPPMGIKYRKVVNDVEFESSFQSLQPDEFLSPLSKQQPLTMAMVKSGEIDASWARSHVVPVPLNETLINSGNWGYQVLEVHDALGNRVNFQKVREDHPKARLKPTDLNQGFTVHERPRALLRGCDSQTPIRIAKGQKATLPVRFGSTGKTDIADAAYHIRYVFTPEDDVSSSGEHNLDVQKVKTETWKAGKSGIMISDSGLYTLLSVATDYCEGEIHEPASCMLYNPPEPELSYKSEEIHDTCAGKPIGLRVVLNLLGSPPFIVRYTEEKKGDKLKVWQTLTIPGSRYQLELTPREAGQYTYIFQEINDEVYKGQSLGGAKYTLEQDVKPSVSASFVDAGKKRSCLDEPVDFSVRLQGEGPWTLEYELKHGNKRNTMTIGDVTSDIYTVTTPPLMNGGDYTISLTSVIDKTGCKEFLDQEAKVFVRPQRPKVAFGQLEGKRVIKTLEGKNLDIPLRLTGEKPWKITYRNERASPKTHTQTVLGPNDVLKITQEGMYELLGVEDAECPGSVDESAKQFSVSWISRPTMQVAESPLIEYDRGTYVKQAVCEGDEDSFDIVLAGTPPFDVRYQEHRKPDSGLRQKQLNAALGVASIQLDTTQAGLVEYQFNRLSDHNYDWDPKRHISVVLQQRVNPRPSARFVHPGKTYSYCTVEEEKGEEAIPVRLTGVPPFSLEVEIKHSGSARPEPLSFPNIPSADYTLRIPHRHLQQGHSNIAIRKVRDSRGCRSKTDPAASPKVQISVHDAPSISPLESQTDYCVGDRISFALSGQVPFNVYYTFEGASRKAASSDTTFRRLAEKPGVFTITGVSDSASQCKASTHITKTIHPLPSVKVSKGKESIVDIHEGGEADILFEFGGTPPFEFTYTRSENSNKRSGKPGRVLETKTAVSAGYSLSIAASEEGTYEVVSIRDKWCSVSRSGVDGKVKHKMLTY